MYNVCKLNRLVDAILMSTLNIPLFYIRLKRHLYIIPICLLILALWITLSGLNYPYLAQISMLQKMFEPSSLDFTNFRNYQ